MLSGTVGRTRPHIASAFRARLRESAAGCAVTGQPDREVLAALRDSGLLSLAVPAEYGGAGGGAPEVNRTVEELATVNPSIALIAHQHYTVTSLIAEWGSRAQRESLLPALADGGQLAASAWSETLADTARTGPRGSAVRRDDGGWTLDGGRAFTAGAHIADVYLVLAATAEGAAEGAGEGPGGGPGEGAGTGDGPGAQGRTFFLVGADNPGVAVRSSPDLAGMRGSATGLVTLRHCQVPDADRLGPRHGAHRAIAGLRGSGVTLGAVSVGLARAALDLAVGYANRHDLLTGAAFRHRLGDLATRLESARAIVDRAGAGLSPDPELTALYCKVFASTAAEEICLDVARIVGEAGYLAGDVLTRLLADARGVALLGPTNDLCREVLAESWRR
ncbi:acyl-CoA dehydrogenase family protein [Streptomyces sp. O3]